MSGHFPATTAAGPHRQRIGNRGRSEEAIAAPLQEGTRESEGQVREAEGQEGRKTCLRFQGDLGSGPLKGRQGGAGLVENTVERQARMGKARRAILLFAAGMSCILA